MTRPDSDTDRFADRHIGPSPAERDAMLAALGLRSLDQLIAEVVPAGIRLKTPLAEPAALSEAEYLAHVRRLGERNQVYRSFIGLGYHGTVTPAVILRTVFENPSWYTPYTPYQAEIAQGRLEALLTFQTMVTDLTGMEVANASLLDEATAAAEAMTMLARVSPRREADGRVFLVDQRCYPQTLFVLASRAEPLDIEVRVEAVEAMRFDEHVYGVLLQYPDGWGEVRDPSRLIERAHEAGVLVAVATDLLATVALTPPGELGADVVVGSAQRLGVPMGYGGPHAAFFATRERFVRQSPGRLIGVSVDAQGNPAYRMALQTREQHIRREKATSNICTAQALLANMAGFYAVYHGPEGFRRIATRVHALTTRLEAGLDAIGFTQANAGYFDTLRVPVADEDTHRRLLAAADDARVNLRHEAGWVGVTLDETTSTEDVEELIGIFARAAGRQTAPAAGTPATRIPAALARRTPFLRHEVFNGHHSETEMMRYLKTLERRDIGLDVSMIPLGSCTMKLNAAAEMIPVSWPGFAHLHPFAPIEQAEGYAEIFRGLGDMIRAITGLDGVSLQPNSGAQGELAGLLVLRAYHRDRGDANRNVVLIPSSAHGTNPASAVMAGMHVVVVACDRRGNVDLEDLRQKAAAHASRLAALMITYPSTHGVFEDEVRQICEVVHRHGGQVYMDGANLNAQVGLTSPASIGADVCHLNLHKTFAIPHGGGGPGMGPIAVASHLTRYLPGHPLVKTGGDRAIAPVAAAPWGSASILLISYGYMRMLGGAGMTEASGLAILNANYVKHRLEPYFPVLYVGKSGRVAHELICDLRQFKAASGVDEADVAKRLIDYGFHAPTISFPVAGTMMIEPTESESKAELDRFCDALVAIRGEIQDVVEGRADRRDNVLKNAPHTATEASADAWSHPYTRAAAVYPLPYVRAAKFWPPVGRIDNAYGDRNLMCTCAPVEAYATEEPVSP